MMHSKGIKQMRPLNAFAQWSPVGVILVAMIGLLGLGSCGVEAAPTCKTQQPMCVLTQRPANNCNAKRTEIHDCNAVGEIVRTGVTLQYESSEDSYKKVKTALENHTQPPSAAATCNTITKTGESNSACAWDYIGQSEQNRIPETIFTAVLRGDSPSKEYNIAPASGAENGQSCTCSPVKYPTRVLRLKCNDSTDVEEWNLEVEEVTAGFACRYSL